MVTSLGLFLKTLREDVFDNVSQRHFAENMLRFSKSKYNNIEKGVFKNSMVSIIDEIAEPLAKLFISDITAKSKLKNVTLQYFLSNFAGMQDCNYLVAHEIDNYESMKNYLKFALCMACGKVSPNEQIEGEFQFHADRNYVINKMINIINPIEILLISHIEDYNIHLKFAKDNKDVKFDCHLEGLTPNIKPYIVNIVKQEQVSNMSLSEYSLKTCLQYKLPTCVFIPYFMHHLQEADKIELLKQIYHKLSKNSYLIVLDPFLDDNDPEHIKFHARWDIWIQGVKSKKFFINLQDFSNDSIEFADEFANMAEKQDIQMGESYIQNNDVQPITLDWMKNIAETIGFKVLLMKHTNTTSDAIFVLQK